MFTGQHEGCGHDSSLEVKGDFMHTGIKMFLPGSKDSESEPKASGSLVKTSNQVETEPKEKIVKETKDANGLITTPIGK